MRPYLLPVAFLLALTSSAVANTSAGPTDSTAAPILLELFTSQGCSSCPPADRLLNSLAKKPDLIAISRPVTYWDRLGWKDSNARPENDRLQRHYAALGLPGSGVYTPEIVIQGRYATVGSRAQYIDKLIARARLPIADAPVFTLVATVAGTAATHITSNRPAPYAQIKFFALASERRVAIGSGENARRRVTYSNVVLAESSSACPTQKPCTATMPTSIAKQSGADRWVAVLQQHNSGKVLAAQWISPAQIAQE